ncbi:MAG TPA: cyclic nucleotide-binding domain-containing protein, partial [Chitinophaga sp.]|nr:cyclic nucleotide-binding domain-containing protein [Chitinophaga sp.]
MAEHIRKFIPLTEEEQQVLFSYLRYQEVKRKEHLLRQGQICSANYFVLKGCLRMYYINDSGIEQIVHFGIDNWWITDYDSLDKRIPAQYFI